MHQLHKPTSQVKLQVFMLLVYFTEPYEAGMRRYYDTDVIHMQSKSRRSWGRGLTPGAEHEPEGNQGAGLRSVRPGDSSESLQEMI